MEDQSGEAGVHLDGVPEADRAEATAYALELADLRAALELAGKVETGHMVGMAFLMLPILFFIMTGLGEGEIGALLVAGLLLAIQALLASQWSRADKEVARLEALLHETETDLARLMGPAGPHASGLTRSAAPPPDPGTTPSEPEGPRPGPRRPGGAPEAPPA